MKISLLTIDGTARHQVSPRIIVDDTTLTAYPAPAGYVAVEYSAEHDALPIHQETPPVVVPDVVTNAQFRRALIRSNIMPSSVLAAIEAMPTGATREEARTQWEYANTIERGNPLIAQLAPAFGLTSAQVDSLFILAATL